MASVLWEHGMETSIGAGGWGYFKGPSGNALSDYSRGFRFVEVNTTFYRHPSLVDARRWRKSVPADFRFAVKVHRAITHLDGFRPTRRALSAVARDVAISRTLGADILVFETPPDVRFEAEQIEGLKEFSATLARGQRIALEPRAYVGRLLPRSLAAPLEDVGGIHVVDLSKGDVPQIGSDVLYTRLLGKGIQNLWEFSDEELREIDAVATSTGSNRRVFAFHGVRMYKDAARFTEFRATGALPPATRGRGQQALEEVLAPDSRFPATRDELIRDHGWKAVSTDEFGNVHAHEYLQRLPPRSFPSLREVMSALSALPLASLK